MIAINAEDAKNDWSLIADQAIKGKPMFITHNRDYLVLSDIRFIENILSVYTFSVERYIEEDGSVTLSLNELDLIENSFNEEDAKLKLARSIIEYSEDFYNDFKYWSSAPNRAAHIPYVFKALMVGEPEVIGESISLS